MADQILNQQQFNGGISVSDKMGVAGSYAFSQQIDIHQDPSHFQLAVAPAKASASIVTDLVKWAATGAPYDTNRYFYGSTGNIYKEDVNGTWSLLRAVSASHGQGMCVYRDYLYYMRDADIGRYGPLDGSPTFNDTWGSGNSVTITNTATTGFAPIIDFGGVNGILVWGSGTTIGSYDGSVITSSLFNVLAGVNIRCFGTLQNYLVIGTWRSTSGSISDSEEGYLYFWDGVSRTFNFLVNIPEGSCNALQNSRNFLYGVLGSQGLLYLDQYTYINSFAKVMNFPKLKAANFVEVYPGAMNQWQGKIYYAPANSDSSDIVRGVYEWGSIVANFPDCLNMPFIISTGNTGSTVHVGCVQGFGKSLYIGWQDNATFGVDKVTRGGNYALSGYVDLFWFDNQQSFKEKGARIIKVQHAPLNPNEYVQLAYRKNRSQSLQFGAQHVYSASEDAQTAGVTRFAVPFADQEFNEFQIRCVIGTTTGATTPIVFSVGMQFDDFSDNTDY